MNWQAMQHAREGDKTHANLRLENTKERKRILGRSRCKWEDIITMYIKEIG
jgi:hypothetical protein